MGGLVCSLGTQALQAVAGGDAGHQPFKDLHLGPIGVFWLFDVCCFTFQLNSVNLNISQPSIYSNGKILRFGTAKNKPTESLITCHSPRSWFLLAQKHRALRVGEKSQWRNLRKRLAD